LKATIQTLFSSDRGLLAMDESTPTADRRFAALGIPQTVEMRQKYRELIVTTSGLGESIGGAILVDETIRQSVRDGDSFVSILQEAGIIPGIKVDAGAKDLALHSGEKITEGLDGLRDRLIEYFGLGARFAKWRAVITIGDGIPSAACIHSNVEALARYAALCQETGLVPIVEPEVLMDGTHDLIRCQEVTEKVQHALFNALILHGVALEGTILKPNMVLPGLDFLTQDGVEETADATIQTLLRTVPAAIPAVAFLSGGQSGELASARLNAMNRKYKNRMPWIVTFSYARAIQQQALDIWNGSDQNVARAQEALLHRAACNRAARRGEYTPESEQTTSI
jgi:fructose-bisphosphate aldolase, class I